MKDYISMWEYEQGIFAYQTEYEEISMLMKKHGFSLFNWGVNCNHWVYHNEESNLIEALKTLKTLTGINPTYNKRKDVWECYLK